MATVRMASKKLSAALGFNPMPSQEKTALVVISFFALVGIVWGANASLVRAEHIECQKWLRESQEFSAHWFSTEWQYSQCLQFGIELVNVQKTK